MNIEDVLKGHGICAGSNIKSIQRGTASFTKTPAITQLAVTISNVDITKCIVRISSGDAGTNGANHAVKGVLINSTTLQLNRVSGAENTAVYWEVIEFNNVKSLQKGSITMTTTQTSITVSITEVNLSKAALFFSYNTDYASYFYQFALKGELNTSTSIYFYKPDTTYGRAIEWIVIEFN